LIQALSWSQPMGLVGADPWPRLVLTQVFEQQSPHLEVCIPGKGPIEDSPNHRTQEVSSCDPLVNMKICGAELSIVAQKSRRIM
jgi:hypothetical protein